jgi:hypothetical protein
MSQSTPINMIRRTGGENNDMRASQGSQVSQGSQGQYDIGLQGSDSQLVEDILKEMGESPSIEQQSSINSQALQYAMDSSQVPPHKYTPESQPSPLDYNNYSQKMAMENQNGILNQFGFSLNSETLKAKIIKNIKYPVIVFVLSFLISLPEFNRFLFGFFPRLLLESGQVGIGGVFLKALIGMILFSLISLVV